MVSANEYRLHIRRQVGHLSLQWRSWPTMDYDETRSGSAERGPHMPENDTPSNQAQNDAEGLITRALSQPGVAEIVAVYEAVEDVYVNASNALSPHELASNSTEEPSWLLDVGDVHLG